MFDTKAKNGKGLAYSKPSSLEDLISNPEYHKSVIIQDPRSSAAGLALLLWLRSVYGEKTTEKFPQLKRQLLSITKGWSEAYKLFTSGEAPIVLSYTTSEAYHREQDKTDRYQALIFPEGHYLAVEHAAILRSSKQIDLAKMFLRHLLMPNSQTTIASKNWMYPVISSTILPKAYAMIQLPNQVLQLKPTEIDKNREKWIKEWQTQIRKN
jgi:thiamine transport system substrate-binding protein